MSTSAGTAPGVLEQVASAADRVVSDVRGGTLAGAPLELLAATLGELRRLQAKLEWLSLQVVREVDVSGSHVADGALTPRSWLRQRARMSSSEATTAVRTARALGSGLLDATSHALAEGEIDPAHARLIAKDALDAPAGAIALIEPIALDAARQCDPHRVAEVMRGFRTPSTPTPPTKPRYAGTSSAASPPRRRLTAWWLGASCWSPLSDQRSSQRSTRQGRWRRATGGLRRSAGRMHSATSCGTSCRRGASPGPPAPGRT